MRLIIALALLLVISPFSLFAQGNKYRGHRTRTSVSRDYFPNFLAFKSKGSGMEDMFALFEGDMKTRLYIRIIDGYIKLSEQTGVGPEVLCYIYDNKSQSQLKLRDDVFINYTVFKTSVGFCAVGVGSNFGMPSKLLFIKFSALPIKISYDEMSVFEISWIDTYMFESKDRSVCRQKFHWDYKKNKFFMDTKVIHDKIDFVEFLMTNGR